MGCSGVDIPISRHENTIPMDSGVSRTRRMNRIPAEIRVVQTFLSVISLWNGHARRRVVTVIADDSLCPFPSMSDSIAPVPKTLYRWQRDALDAWAGHGHRGIVEAVTGAGKTELGIRAVVMRLETGGVAAVVVPTRELIYQWARGLRRELSMVELGLLGDGTRCAALTCWWPPSTRRGVAGGACAAAPVCWWRTNAIGWRARRTVWRSAGSSNGASG